MKALLLAGGTGTRLWPLSRTSHPKQVCPFFDTQTLLQKTWQRITPYFSPDDIWVSTSESHFPLIQSQLPEVKHYSLEREGRNTAPAIGLATLRIYSEDPDNIIVTINSDHFIGDRGEYLKVLKVAEEVVRKHPGQVLLIGIKTEYPETGYGYIERGEKYDTVQDREVFQVASFKEKPDMPTAERYHNNNKFLWNPAIFVFSVSRMLDLFKVHLPEHYELLLQIQKVIGDEEKVQELFLRMQSISIDYGIMEKTDSLLVLPVDFEWRDVGSFNAVYDIMKNKQQDSSQNVVNGKYLGIDSHRNLVHTTKGKMVATVGIDDCVIIDTDDALLIAPRDRSQEVKKIVGEMKNTELKKYL